MAAKKQDNMNEWSKNSSSSSPAFFDRERIKESNINCKYQHALVVMISYLHISLELQDGAIRLVLPLLHRLQLRVDCVQPLRLLRLFAELWVAIQQLEK